MSRLSVAVRSQSKCRRCGQMCFARSACAIIRRRLQSVCLVAATAVLMSACANLQLPENKPQALFDKEKMTTLDARDVWASRSTGPVVASNGMCAPAGTGSFLLPQDLSQRSPLAKSDRTMRYSPGDRLNVFVPGSPEFGGDYAVNADGRVILPFTGEIEAVGLS